MFLGPILGKNDSPCLYFLLQAVPIYIWIVIPGDSNWSGFGNFAGILLTGARDGNIMVWDTRCNLKNGYHTPINTICKSHERVLPNHPTTASGKKKKKKPSCQVCSLSFWYFFVLSFLSTYTDIHNRGSSTIEIDHLYTTLNFCKFNYKRKSVH